MSTQQPSLTGHTEEGEGFHTHIYIISSILNYSLVSALAEVVFQCAVKALTKVTRELPELCIVNLHSCSASVQLNVCHQTRISDKLLSLKLTQTSEQVFSLSWACET